MAFDEVDQIPANLWGQANKQMLDQANRHVLAGFVYFHSAFLTTQQLVTALGLLENSPEVWYLPSIWSATPIPTSILKDYPPTTVHYG